MSDQPLLDQLKELHGEDFKIEKKVFIKGTGVYQITASPLREPDLLFSAEYKPDNKFFKSYYQDAKISFDAQKHYNELLADHHEKYALNVGVTSSAEIDQTDIPSFKTLLEREGESLNVNFHIYLFEDIDKKNHKKLLKGIVKLTNEIINGDVKRANFAVNFYDEEYFRDKDLKDYSFGFNAPVEEDFENVEKDQFRNKILYKIRNEADEVKASDLFEMLTDKRLSLLYKKL